MCAEAVPWRCHRSLISDALTARGHEVRHILAAGRADPHVMTSFAHVEGGRVTYPGAPDVTAVQDELPLGLERDVSEPRRPRARRRPPAS